MNHRQRHRRMCVDCGQTFHVGHCCCEMRCPGHRMNIDHCAGRCLECGWGGCVCLTEHCCCQSECNGHEWKRSGDIKKGGGRGDTSIVECKTTSEVKTSWSNFCDLAWQRIAFGMDRWDEKYSSFHSLPSLFYHSRCQWEYLKSFWGSCSYCWQTLLFCRTTAQNFYYSLT